MSTGISISSINRIKELAGEKKYAEALEILDTQNLDKSINPQFLRISGEIFRENKRYYDSRRILLKAHQMAPQGIRIIFELIKLYLELGYYTRADRYFQQYLFYSTQDDTQRDYVEYMVKKAAGADVRELASILIPILERMPEDRWNFEAILLYDKLERKDKALAEAQYILENYKNSIYVQQAIEYIEEQLDVDRFFYVYPKEEVEEDRELFGDLIAQDDRILEGDHLRMYPPEARIMVEAEDKEALEAMPVREKKPRRRRKKETLPEEEITVDTSDDTKEKSEDAVEEMPDVVKEALKVSEEMGIKGKPEQSGEEDSEEALRQEREAALDKLLAKKIDKDVIMESAKQVAKAVREIDTSKAKSQVKAVAGSVKDGVKKATDVLGDAVLPKAEESVTGIKPEQEEIVDGIIESVLEPPKRPVGEVITNEELDALIPDSLEAMSADERAEIEAKKEEAQRLEQEALEAVKRLEEEKKKPKKTEPDDIQQPENVEVATTELPEDYDSDLYEQLKAQFLADSAEEEPLDSLGFISVVKSDVDAKMEEAAPDVAYALHRMIDNKEYYSGEDSKEFESQDSYENHGFYVEDRDFEEYDEEEFEPVEQEENLAVEEIYTKERVVDFDNIVPKLELVPVNHKGDLVPFDQNAQTTDDVVTDMEEAETGRYLEKAELLAIEKMEDEASVDFRKNRDALRIRIILTDEMVRGLLELKESR